MIRTKIHKLAEAVRASDFSTKAVEIPVIQQMCKSAIYCFDDTALDLLRKTDLDTTIAAMYDCGAMRLPHKEVTVELPEANGQVDIFYFQDKGDHLTCNYAFWRGELRPSGIYEQPFRVNLMRDGYSFEAPFEIRELESAILKVSAIALSCVFVLLTTRGVERELISPGKLNKARAHDPRKAPIPNHTRVHIARYQKRDGTMEKVVTGRHMPMHLRAGHVKNQAFGPGRKERKLIYIEPVIVNYDPSLEAPVPKPKVVSK